MLGKFTSFWKKNNKKMIITISSFCAVLLVGVVVANAQKLSASFDPNAYASNEKGNDNAVDYDSSVFGTDQSASDERLAVDEKSEEYNLNEGTENNLLDNQNNPQNGLQIADGTGTSGSTNANAVGVSNDGTGTVINSNSGNGTGTGGSGTGSNGTGTGDGSGSGNNGDNGSGSGGEGGERPTPDPDANKYGTDYNSPESTTTYIPASGYVLNSIEASGDLKEHFYEGESPRIEEMSNYITVTATFKNGSKTKTQTLQYKATDTTGGDYTVAWDKDASSTGLIQTNEKTGYAKVGDEVGDYTAVISYTINGVTKTAKTSYDIVHWQITLHDLDESKAEEELGEDYLSFEDYLGDAATLSPTDSPVVDMKTSLEDMTDLVADRTLDKESDYAPYQYTLASVKTDSDISTYSQFFNGWSEDQGATIVRKSYEMKRPTDAQINNGEYNIDFQAQWYDVDDNENEYKIYLSGGLTSLVGYSGTDSCITIPEGIDIFSVDEMGRYKSYFSISDYNQITKIIFPETLHSVDVQGEVNEGIVFPNLTAYQVPESNQSYLDIDGIVYNKTGKELILVPSGKRNISKWSKTVEQIDENAFTNTQMDTIEVPATVTTLEKEAFYDSKITCLTFLTTEQMSWGIKVFANFFEEQSKQRDYVTICGIQKLVLNSTEVPEIIDKSSSESSLIFAVSTMVDITDQMQMIVPDSENNQVYLAYLKRFQAILDKSAGNIGMVYSVLDTNNSASADYTYEDGFLLKEDEQTSGQALVLVSGAIAGDAVVPSTVTTVQNEAFVDCNDIISVTFGENLKAINNNALAQMNSLNMIVMQGDDPAQIQDYVFGEKYGSNLHIYVGTDEILSGYIEAYQDKLDAEYGEGATENLFYGVSGVGHVVADNGALYHPIEEESGTVYELIYVNPETVGIFTPKDETITYKSGCFKDCTALEAVICGSKLQEIEDGAFDQCTSLTGLAFNSSTPPTVSNKAFVGIEKWSVMIFVPYDEDKAIYNTYYAAIINLLDICDGMENSAVDYYGTQTVSGNYLNGAIYGTDAINGGVTICHALHTSGGTFSLPSGTTAIANYAFYGLGDITGVTGANAVVTVGDSSFANCISLRGISSLNACTTLGSKSFKSATSLKSLLIVPTASATTITVIPSGITTIPDNCFSGCTSITNLNMYNSGNGNVETIQLSAFKACTGIQTISYANAIKTIGDSAFYGCSSLSSESWSRDAQSSLTEVGNQAYYNCSKYVGDTAWFSSYHYTGETTKIAEYYPNVTTVGEYAYYNTAITGIVLKEHVTSIGTGAFSNCVSVDYLNVTGNHFAKIATWRGDQQFTNVVGLALNGDCTSLSNSNIVAYCPNLAYVELGYHQESVIVKDDLFSGLTNMVELHADGGNIEGLTENTFSGTPLYKMTVAGDYSNSTTDFNCIKTLQYVYLGFDGTPLVLKDGMFKDNTNIQKVFLYAPVTAIPESLFENCTSLQYVYNGINANLNVASIGSNAFKNCAQFISMPFSWMQSLKTIGDSVFENCTSLVGENWGGTIGNAIRLQSSVTSVGVNCFKNCTSLLRFDNYMSCPSIPEGMFYGCTSLKQLGWSVGAINNLTTIGAYSFYGCKNYSAGLNWVNYNYSNTTYFNKVSYIGDYAYAGCTSLTTFENDAQQNITYFGTGVFEGCNKMSKATFNGSVDMIGSASFKDCSNLQIVTLNTMPAIAEDIFDGCSSLYYLKLGYDLDLESLDVAALAVFSGVKYFDIYGSIGTLTGNLADWDNLTDFYVDGGYVGELGAELFANNQSIETAFLDTVDSVGSKCFQNCSSLTWVDFYDIDITSIATDAFWGCTSIDYICIDDDNDVTDQFALEEPVVEELSINNTTEGVSEDVLQENEELSETENGEPAEDNSNEETERGSEVTDGSENGSDSSSDGSSEEPDAQINEN